METGIENVDGSESVFKDDFDLQDIIELEIGAAMDELVDRPKILIRNFGLRGIIKQYFLPARQNRKPATRDLNDTVIDHTVVTASQENIPLNSSVSSEYVW